MALGALKNSFTGRALGAGLAGLTALTPMTASAQEATPVVADCGVMNAEICELDQMADAARAYATENSSVAILFHIGDDVRSRENGAEIMARVEAHIIGQFAEHGIEAEAFSRTNFDVTATGLTYHYGNLVFLNADGRINLDLQEGLDAIPKVIESLNFYRQTANAQVLPAAEPSGS